MKLNRKTAFEMISAFTLSACLFGCYPISGTVEDKHGAADGLDNSAVGINQSPAAAAERKNIRTQHGNNENAADQHPNQGETNKTTTAPPVHDTLPKQNPNQAPGANQTPNPTPDHNHSNETTPHTPTTGTTGGH